MSTIRSPPNAVCSTTMPAGSLSHLADHRRPRAGRMRTHRRQHTSASVAATTATSLPSLARYSGSSPRISQAPLTSSRIGSASSRMRMPTSETLRELVQHRGNAAARRIAQAVDVRARGQHRTPPARPAAGSRSLHRPPVRAGCARSGSPRRDRRERRSRSPRRLAAHCRADIATPCGTTPMPAVLMNSLSAAPRSTTLVSPGHDRDAGLDRDALHAGRHAAQDVDGQPLLHHHAARQEQRSSRRTSRDR